MLLIKRKNKQHSVWRELKPCTRVRKRERRMKRSIKDVLLSFLLFFQSREKDGAWSCVGDLHIETCNCPAAEIGASGPVLTGEHKEGIPRYQAVEKGMTNFLKTHPRPFSLKMPLSLISKGLLPSFQVWSLHPFVSHMGSRHHSFSPSPSCH